MQLSEAAAPAACSGALCALVRQHVTLQQGSDLGFPLCRVLTGVHLRTGQSPSCSHREGLDLSPWWSWQSLLTKGSAQLHTQAWSETPGLGQFYFSLKQMAVTTAFGIAHENQGNSARGVGPKDKDH